MKNKGKIFEQNFKKSVPSSIFYYRFRDGTGNFNGQKNENVRFQQKNMCDCMLFDGNNLYLLELKNHKGSSLPFSCIRENQLKELSMAQYYSNVISGIIINFEDNEKCYFMFINQITDFIRTSDRKSIPIKYCQENGILIEMEKLKTNYKYNINKMINDLKNKSH